MARAWLIAVLLLRPAPLLAEWRLALVAGHNLGLPDEDPLRFAERDAERFARILLDLGRVRPEDLILLRGPDAAAIDKGLDLLEERLRRDPLAARSATVVFYFAGHGDRESLHLAEQPLARAGLMERLRRLPAGMKLAVLDACQLDRSAIRRGVRPAPSFEIGVLPAGSATGVVVIQSSQQGEPAHESDALGGAVFTHYWLSALRGAADIDGDGRVTLLEAYTFAFRQTVRHAPAGAGPSQRPAFEMDLSGYGEVVLTEPAANAAVLVLPIGPESRYLIFSQPSGALVAEAVASPQQPISLAVPAGRLLVQRRDRDRFAVAEVELPFGGQHHLADGEFSDRPYEVVARRGGQLDLHPVSFGLGYEVRLDRIAGEWVDRHGPRLLVDRTFGALALAADLALGVARYSHDPIRSEEVSLSAAGWVAWRRAVGPGRLDIASGIEALLIRQTHLNTDAQRLRQAGIEIPERDYRLGLALGGCLELGYRLPLSSRLGLRLGLRASLLAIDQAEPDGSRLAAVPSLRFALDLAYRY
jgi:hypothetical protein